MRRCLSVLIALLLLVSPAHAGPKQTADLSFQDLEGKPVALRPLLDQGPVLILVFKTWCSTSVDALHKLEQFQSLYASRTTAFHVLAVGHNSAPVLRAFIDKQHLEGLTVVEDPSPFTASKRLGARQTPTLLLLGADGAVLSRVSGWNRGAYNKVSRKIADLTHLPYTAVSTPADGLPETKAGCVLVNTPELQP